MSRGVGAFRPESRSESVDVTERHSIRLGGELPRNRKRCLFTEKVLSIIYLSVFFRNVCKRQRRNLKHRARTFAIAAGYKRRVNVYKPLRIKKFMNGESRLAPYTKYRAESVGPRTKIRNLTQIFERMSLFLQRIIGGRFALDRYVFRFYFKRLFCFGCQNESSGDTQRRADVLFRDFVVVGKVCPFKYDLNTLKTTAVVQFDKSEFFTVADSSCPTFYGYVFAAERLRARI